MCALLLHSFGSALGIDKLSTSHCNLETLPQRAALSYNISLRPPLSLHPPDPTTSAHSSSTHSIALSPVRFCLTLPPRKTRRCHLRSRLPYIRLLWSAVQLWPSVLGFTSLPKSTRSKKIWLKMRNMFACWLVISAFVISVSPIVTTELSLHSFLVMQTEGNANVSPWFARF